MKLPRVSILLLVIGCGGGSTTGPATDARAPDGAAASDGSTQEEAGTDAAVGDGAASVDGGTDAGENITDAAPGNGALGAPCTSDNQCTGALCLGGAFTGGYCSSPVAECDPGGAACGDGGICTKSGGVDVDGATRAEFCLDICTGPGGCRQGYSCCYGATYSQMAGLMVCVPPCLCPDQ